MHDRRRLRQQFAEHLRGNIGPQSDFLGKNSIALGTRDQAKRSATSQSPRRISTSVTASPSAWRAEMACRCAYSFSRDR
jgi:hypothetical protein